ATGPSASVFSRLRADTPGAGTDVDSSTHPVTADTGSDVDHDHDHDAEPEPPRPVPHLVVVPRHRDEPDDAAPSPPMEPEPAATSDDDVHLDDRFDPTPSRDALLDELTRPVVRRMKRSLTDEQNEVLDAVRRRRPLPSLDELLSTVAEHERRYAEATV